MRASAARHAHGYFIPFGFALGAATRDHPRYSRNSYTNSVHFHGPPSPHGGRTPWTPHYNSRVSVAPAALPCGMWWLVAWISRVSAAPAYVCRLARRHGSSACARLVAPGQAQGAAPRGGCHVDERPSGGASGGASGGPPGGPCRPLRSRSLAHSTVFR